MDGDGRYRFTLIEQILIIWGIVEFNAPALAPGVTSVPGYATAMKIATSMPTFAKC
jgi:hypothetical protein